MNEERLHILQMVAEGKLTANEAERLIEALDVPDEKETRPFSGQLLRFRVFENNKAKLHVNIPLELGRIVLGFLPQDSRARNIDWDSFTKMVKEGASGKVMEVSDERYRVELFVE